MNDYRPSNEPSGIRLMRLMDTRLVEILRKEQSNDRRIRLYGTGTYWTAFEQSAYLLCGLFSKNVVSVVTHAAYPFPVVMASITDEELRTYARRHIFICDSQEYKELLATEISQPQYRIWHRQEVQKYL